MTTGERIKAARKKAGLTQSQLGERLGVSGSMIAQYETDKRKPKIEALQRIAAALDEDVSILLPEQLAETYEILTPISEQLIALNKEILKQDYCGNDYYYFYTENDSHTRIVPRISPVSLEDLYSVQEIRDYLRVIESYCPLLSVQDMKKVAFFVKEIAGDMAIPNGECFEHLFSAWMDGIYKKIRDKAPKEASADEATSYMHSSPAASDDE